MESMDPTFISFNMDGVIPYCQSVYGEANVNVGVYGIHSYILKVVIVNIVGETYASSFLLRVDDESTILLYVL